MSVLATTSRRELEEACLRGRRVAESACAAALDSLGVSADRPPSHLADGDRVLRRGLRAKSRQLGDENGSLELLVGECAYEQWHRLLFARFLAENGLLIHPDFKAPVTLAECEELAVDLGEPDGWSVAARFAAQILPGIFRLDDPCVQLRLAPEGRLGLERIVADLSPEVFVADDALGWVYQFWQRDKKDEVNASERKIGGADLGPVTQLFTENYMVRFLLENSLGAWWAARHPDSQLVKEWDYLRFDDDGQLAAGGFEQWPERVAEVTVMDPCCGSGHFLVEAFSMLWQMRVEEESLSAVAAQDAVLRDNLFGLELDPRCVQIAMFAIALQAWKAGGGWRELPVPHIACSGILVKAPVGDWKQLAKGNERLENALVRLHILFRDADTLGSLIDPKRAVEITDPTGLQSSFEDADWDEVGPLVARALSGEAADPAITVLGADATGIARAADYLSRRYTLVATNVPFLTSQNYSSDLGTFLESRYPPARANLGTAFLMRALEMVGGGTVALVAFSGWLSTGTYEDLRRQVEAESSIQLVARMRSAAFSTPLWDFGIALFVIDSSTRQEIAYLDLEGLSEPSAVDSALRDHCPLMLERNSSFHAADFRFVDIALPAHAPLSLYCSAHLGLHVGDDIRYRRQCWELPQMPDWELFATSPSRSSMFEGLDSRIYWPDEGAAHEANPHARVQGREAWNRRGVVVRLTGDLPASLYTGELYSQNVAVLLPASPGDLAAIWLFVRSEEYRRSIRALDRSLKVTAGTLVKVPFDVDHWRSVAEERFPDGLPEPWSDDPTQWLFEGRPEVATEPLQVAAGRLLGYRWPGQSEADDLVELADDDGIVCLPSVLGERGGAERLREVLARAFGMTWSPTKTRELVSASGSKKKDLESWLRDDFFKAHCKLFKNRPFIWHIWDGRNDGFSALVNYHRLGRATLERLTFTYLGDWIERQKASVRDDVAGAEERLAAAQDLERRLRLILDGEPPYDVYVRWKALSEQPLGWDPDLNDGVRLNVRPFVEADVLRAKFNVKWGKDRGKNPDGSERHNDLHYTRAEREAARQGTQP